MSTETQRPTWRPRNALPAENFPAFNPSPNQGASVAVRRGIGLGRYEQTILPSRSRMASVVNSGLSLTNSATIGSQFFGSSARTCGLAASRASVVSVADRNCTRLAAALPLRIVTSLRASSRARCASSTRNQANIAAIGTRTAAISSATWPRIDRRKIERGIAEPCGRSPLVNPHAQQAWTPKL